MSVNDHRKCAKCSRTRAEDTTVTYHRFPNPGKANITKARAWAKYCWPNEDWTDEDLHSLHKANKVLCGRHFTLSQFYDNKKQKLSKFAIPDLMEEGEHSVNILKENINQSSVGQRVPFSPIENLQTTPMLVKPSTSAQVTKQQMIVEDKTETESTGNKQYLPTKIQNQESTSDMDMHSQDSTSHVEVPDAPKKSKSKKSLGILSTINVSKLRELNDRETKLYNICRKKLREINRLRKKLKNRKADPIRCIAEDDNVRKLSDLKISNSFLILLQSQLKNWPQKPKGRRYTLQQKIMALVLYKKSPACYRLLRRMFALPCQSNLNKLLNRVPLKPGINKHIFESLKNMAENHTDEENLCILSFDEMSIRKHLHYDSKIDEIQGFQDHGNHGRNDEVATKALVFMLAGVRKKWKQPIAFYFSHTLTADRLTMILREILTECFMCNINVVSTVCDLSTVNIKVLKTLGATTREPYFVHDGREIVAILDPPHLLKCTRNLLMKYDVECTTDLQQNVKGTVKWSHIQLFYDMDKNNPNFVYAPALSEIHLHPNLKQKMRVKLAAQVLSHSVAAGMLAKIASNELPSEAHATAMFIQRFDNLFDAINADSPDLRRGKKFSTNLTARSPHMAFFGEMRKFISEMKYIRVGSKPQPPSQEGWIHTMNAIERLWKNLQNMEIRSLSTRRLNQDPLEKIFGCIRYNCGSNNNPTIQQFVGGFKTAIISNLRHSGQKRNCEDDAAVLSNNLASFLTSEVSVEAFHLADNTCDIESLLSDAVEEVEQATPESQACGYVSGFIFKKLKHDPCIDCCNVFLTESLETIHIFTTFKEYTDKNSLKYVNKDMVQCVESIATIVNNYLTANASAKNIKVNLMSVLDIIDFSFLNKCAKHIELNKNHVKLSTFFICIKRYVVLRNRKMEDEEKTKMERKMRILKSK